MNFNLNAVLYILISITIIYELYKSTFSMHKLYILTSVIIVGILITKNIYFSILIGLLLTYIIDTLIDSNNTKIKNTITTVEGMQNRKKGKNNKKIKKKTKELNHLMADISGLLKDIKLNKNEANEPFSKSNEFFIDKKKTKEDLYNNMNTQQKKGLKKDTLELINTQKQLIETMKEMGPVLSQGKNIMQSFDQYFGKNDKNQDISVLMKRMKDMKIT